MTQVTPLIEQTAQVMLQAGMNWREGAYELRRAMIRVLLRQHKGNLCRTARALGTHRNTLSRALQVLHLDDLPRQIRAELRKQPPLKYGGRMPARNSSQRLNPSTKVA